MTKNVKRAKTKKVKRATRPPPRTVKIADAVAEAFSEIESLAEEMQAWADNMEPNLSHTAKFEAVTEAADRLENQINPVAYMDKATLKRLAGVLVTIQDPAPSRRHVSRASRRDDAATKLIDCINAADEYRTNSNDDASYDDLEQLSEDLQDIVNEIECVEFPGMFG